jgi:hypothetical protein
VKTPKPLDETLLMVKGSLCGYMGMPSSVSKFQVVQQPGYKSAAASAMVTEAARFVIG